MLEKAKKLIIKIHLKYLIIYLILSVAIVFIDKSGLKLSFLNQFESDWIQVFVKLGKDIKTIYEKVVGLFYVLIILDIVIIIIRCILKNESIKVMIVNTFENTKVDIKTKYIYENKDFYKDLSQEIKILNGNHLAYNEIVKKLDNYAENFMENKKEKYYAFAGIMHTPFILRLGYKIGDNTYFKLFHKKRNEPFFELISDRNEYVGSYPEMKIEKQLKQSDELVVSIATTFDITREELKRFDLNLNSYIKFETDEKGFDIITSEQQVNDYKAIIFNTIRKVCKEKNIKKVHLCISSSVAFTFALGQGFSNQYDSDVIIYNYDNKKYTWGLKLFEKSENCIIYNEESKVV